MTTRAVLVRSQLEKLLTLWRERSNDGRLGHTARFALATCAAELELALRSVQREISERARVGWQTRRKNERKRARRNGGAS